MDPWLEELDWLVEGSAEVDAEEKRLRNRQYAARSRRRKKDLIVRLQDENESLKNKVETLEQELRKREKECNCDSSHAPVKRMRLEGSDGGVSQNSDLAGVAMAAATLACSMYSNGGVQGHVYSDAGLWMGTCAIAGRSDVFISMLIDHPVAVFVAACLLLLTLSHTLYQCLEKEERSQVLIA